MPVVSRFFGIEIRIYYADHMPPHFHANYGVDEAVVAIETLEVWRGRLPRRALGLVLEWAVLHRAEVRADWERARRGVSVVPIPPLE